MIIIEKGLVRYATLLIIIITVQVVGGKSVYKEMNKGKKRFINIEGIKENKHVSLKLEVCCVDQTSCLPDVTEKTRVNIFVCVYIKLRLNL